MSDLDSTCWTMIQGAASGSAEDRELFARVYEPVVRAYFEARWGRSSRADDIEDAVQEVFLDCFKEGGVLERVTGGRPEDFRAFLYGVTRVAAQRIERDRQRDRMGREEVPLDGLVRDETSLSRAFDRAWAKAIVKEAAARYRERAEALDAAARMRVQILRLRFYEDLDIRDIAARWEIPSAHVQEEYRRARHEFEEVLKEVLAFHHPGSVEEAARRCVRLLSLYDR